MTVQFDTVLLQGGLDQTTQTLNLAGGVARTAVNFECGVSGGYTRIAGYERFDGHAAPSDNARIYISVGSFVNTPVVGNTITNGTATGVLAYIDGLMMVLTKVSGSFAIGNTISVGATTIGVLDSISAGPRTTVEYAKSINAAADIYRADISEVPGSGPVRGVATLGGVTYSFRNNALGTALDIYKSTASGWSQVALAYSVSFTAGGATAPAEGATLTQGGVTAVIKRVVKTSGDFLYSTAAGQIIIAAPAGGSFAAGAATVGAITVTLSGVQTTQVLLPGGQFEIIEKNFAGQAQTTRLYCVDGVNNAFEFDGAVMVPIYSGHPTSIWAHRGYLWLAVGSSLIYSGPRLPYEYTALAGAGEIAVGSDITGMTTMPGSQTASTMAVFTRPNSLVLYGTSPDDFNLVDYNLGVGGNQFTIQNLSQTFSLDDIGIFNLQTTLQFGNFVQSTLTANIQPFIKSRLDLSTASTVNRGKSQYRVFFSDGWGLYCTVVNGKLLGTMPVYFPHPVTCCWEGKDTDGSEVIFFGSTNGFVYRLDKGTSFDGDNIEYNITLNFSHAKSPRVLKKYRRAAVEIVSWEQAYIELSIGYKLGYGDLSYEQSRTQDFTKFVGSSYFDQFYWDSFFWDSSSMGPISVDLGGTAENIAISLYGASDYVKEFNINSLIIHYSPRRVMR